MLYYRQPLGTIAFMSGIWATPTEFTKSWGRLIAYSYEHMLQPGEFLEQVFPPASQHSSARNYLSRMVMGDWIWTSDTDHEFEPDLLARMVGIIRKWDVDVLTAVYRYKAPPWLPTVYWWNEETQSYVMMAELDWNADLAEIACAGAGCLLIRKCVFDKMYKELPAGEEPFDIIGKWGEDFSFFTRCRRLGIKVYAAPKIESRHLIAHGVSHKDWVPGSVETIAIPNGGEAVAKPARVNGGL